MTKLKFNCDKNGHYVHEFTFDFVPHVVTVERGQFRWEFTCEGQRVEMTHDATFEEIEECARELAGQVQHERLYGRPKRHLSDAEIYGRLD